MNYSDPYGLEAECLRPGVSRCSLALTNVIITAHQAAREFGEFLNANPDVAEWYIPQSLVPLMGGDANNRAHRVQRGTVAAARSIAYLRRRAVGQAWAQEADMVLRTGRGTRDWTEAEADELLTTGRVNGYHGHHVNRVNGHPELAGDPNNVEFVRAETEHLSRHNGNYRNQTTGEMKSRGP